MWLNSIRGIKNATINQDFRSYYSMICNRKTVTSPSDNLFIFINKRSKNIQILIIFCFHLAEKETLMEKHANRFESLKNDIEQELLARLRISGFKWKILSFNALKISVHLQDFDSCAKEGSSHAKYQVNEKQLKEDLVF